MIESFIARFICWDGVGNGDEFRVTVYILSFDQKGLVVVFYLRCRTS